MDIKPREREQTAYTNNPPTRQPRQPSPTLAPFPAILTSEMSFRGESPHVADPSEQDVELLNLLNLHMDVLRDIADDLRNLLDVKTLARMRASCKLLKRLADEPRPLSDLLDDFRFVCVNVHRVADLLGLGVPCECLGDDLLRSLCSNVADAIVLLTAGVPCKILGADLLRSVSPNPHCVISLIKAGVPYRFLGKKHLRSVCSGIVAVTCLIEAGVPYRFLGSDYLRSLCSGVYDVADLLIDAGVPYRYLGQTRLRSLCADAHDVKALIGAGVSHEFLGKDLVCGLCTDAFEVMTLLRYGVPCEFLSEFQLDELLRAYADRRDTVHLIEMGVPHTVLGKERLRAACTTAKRVASLLHFGVPREFLGEEVFAAYAPGPNTSNG